MEMTKEFGKWACELEKWKGLETLVYEWGKLKGLETLVYELEMTMET